MPASNGRGTRGRNANDCRCSGQIPYAVLFLFSILFCCCIGTYGINNNLQDLFITAAFGLIGYLLMRLNLVAAPLMLGFILGSMLEEYFRRRSMLLSRASFATFFTHPIGAASRASSACSWAGNYWRS